MMASSCSRIPCARTRLYGEMPRRQRPVQYADSSPLSSGHVLFRTARSPQIRLVVRLRHDAMEALDADGSPHTPRRTARAPALSEGQRPASGSARTRLAAALQAPEQ